ncbi:MAG: hypothetical protein ACRCWS_02470, partial [Propionibacteriaceae bacterium]
AVIRNTAVQGVLSILYASIVLIVLIIAIRICIKAIRHGGVPTAETEPVPSKIFAPASFVPTATEKKVLGEWKAAGLDPTAGLEPQTALAGQGTGS